MRRGFTLVELLIVIAILAILSTIGINNFISAQIKARDITRKSDLQTIAKSLEAYVNDHQTYPMANNGAIACTPSPCPWGSVFTDGHTTYAAKLPADPGAYSYYYTRSGNGYILYAYLENDNDPARVNYPGINCGGANIICNYKVSSSDIAP